MYHYGDDCLIFDFCRCRDCPHIVISFARFSDKFPSPHARIRVGCWHACSCSYLYVNMGSHVVTVFPETLSTSFLFVLGTFCCTQFPTCLSSEYLSCSWWEPYLAWQDKFLTSEVIRETTFTVWSLSNVRWKEARICVIRQFPWLCVDLSLSYFMYDSDRYFTVPNSVFRLIPEGFSVHLPYLSIS